MKRIMPLLLLLPLLSFGQKDSIITFSEVVLVEGTTKDILFTKARQWFNESFKSSKDVINISDKETGEIAGKCYISSYYIFGKTNKQPVYYNTQVSIFVKDGKYKYEFTNFLTEAVNNSGIGNIGVLTSSPKCPVKYPMVKESKADAMYQNMKIELESSMLPIISSLKQKMSSKESPSDF